MTTTHNLGDQVISIEKLNLHGVPVVHEHFATRDGRTMKELWYINPELLVKVRPGVRDQYRKESTTLRDIDRRATTFAEQHLPQLIERDGIGS